MIVADDFILLLYKNGYAKPFDWKRTMLETSSYTISFDCEKCSRSRHSFQVKVENGIHYIDRTTAMYFIRIHSKKNILPVP